MFHDYFLKFKSKEEMNSVFTSLFSFDPEADTFYQEGVSFDFIGDIFKTDGEVSFKTEGYHVNLRSKEELEVDKYKVDPVTPVRVWA